MKNIINFKEKKECVHEYKVVSDQNRTITCQDCEKDLDPFDCFQEFRLEIGEGLQKMREDMKEFKKEIK